MSVSQLHSIISTVAAKVRAQVWSCGICGGQSGAGAGFLRVLRFPLLIFIPPIAPQSPSSIIWFLYNMPEVATVPSGLSPTPIIIIIIHSIITVHTLSVFSHILVLLPTSLLNSGPQLCVYSRMHSVLYLLGIANRRHWVKQFIPPLSWKQPLRCFENKCLPSRCHENDISAVQETSVCVA
jgi:hypothetical protein